MNDQDIINDAVRRIIITTNEAIRAMSEATDALYATVCADVDDATRVDLLLLSNALHTFLRTVTPEQGEKILN